MKVCFETFGCRLNRAEALQTEADYLAGGWEVTTKHAEADLFVVRGCSVTAHAQRDTEKLIDHLRRHYPTKRILVEGCVGQKGKQLVAAQRIRAATAHGVTPDACVPTRTARAYLKVQDGCAGKCTFCIVPSFRGASRSVPFDDVLEKARRFIGAGYHEIVVTGCNLALYADSGKRLGELVAALAALDPTCRIRLGSLEPGPCAADVVRVMAECANVCRFLHLPVQSGSDRILAAMRRPYLTGAVAELAQFAVAHVPDVRLGCDLMTGFPGETELDFVATCGFVKRLSFTHAHVFPFSARPGTLAAAFPGTVPHAVRKARAHELSALVHEKARRLARTFIGQAVEIVVEGEKEVAGWTSQYFWCKVPSAKTVAKRASRKAQVKVFVQEAHDGVLSGRIDG